MPTYEHTAVGYPWSLAPGATSRSVGGVCRLRREQEGLSARIALSSFARRGQEGERRVVLNVINEILIFTYGPRSRSTRWQVGSGRFTGLLRIE